MNTVSSFFHVKQFNLIQAQVKGNGPFGKSSSLCNRVANFILRIFSTMLWVPSILIYGLGEGIRRVASKSSIPQKTIAAKTPKQIEQGSSLSQTSPSTEPIATSIITTFSAEVKLKSEWEIKENPILPAEALAKINEADEFRSTVEGRYESGAEDTHLFQLLARRYNNLKFRATNGPPLKLMVVGAGPAGLVAAIQAYLEGADVTLVEPRPDFIRDQILRINFESYMDITRILGEDMLRVLDAQDFLSHRFQGQGLRGLFTESSYWVTEIKDLQYILYALLKRLQSLDDKEQKGLHILGGYEFVNFENDNVRIRHKVNKTESLIHADWVCGADGARSKVAEAAGMNALPVSTQDTYAAITFDHPYADDPLRAEMQDNKLDPSIPALPAIVADGIAEIRAASPNNDEIERKLQVIEVHRQRTWIVAEQEILNNTISKENEEEWYRRMRSMSGLDTNIDLDTVQRGVRKQLNEIESDAKWLWTKGRLPVTRFFTSPKTVYLGCEIPPNMLQTMQDDKEEALRWTRSALRAHLPQNVINSLKCRNLNVFPVQLTKRTKFYKDLENGKTKVFLIGDALATPHFLTGSGAVAGMKTAKVFAKLVGRVQSDSKQENEFFKKYEREVNQIITAMQKRAFLGLLKSV